MTRHLHFDLVGGIAGDMTVAALADVGANPEELLRLLFASNLDLPLADVRFETIQKDGLGGLRFHVDQEDQPPHRHWPQIAKIFTNSTLPQDAIDRALSIFEALARAEAAVHNCAIDEVHFHEVGALDSILDVTMTSLALCLLEATSFSCSDVPICQGTVQTEHGILPLPAPATARLLEGFTLHAIEGDIETVTPTGAAILSTLCSKSGGLSPTQVLKSSGMGHGSATLPNRPNVLRVLLGELAPEKEEHLRGNAVVIEASIDDMDPRIYGQVAAHLFAAGALDVVTIPQQMKKQRPGTLLSVVARPELEGVLTGLLLRETTTLGVRSWDVRRTELARRFETVNTPYGEVRVKIGVLGGETYNASPEYEDCATQAEARGVPVKDVLAAAIAAASTLADKAHS